MPRKYRGNKATWGGFGQASASGPVTRLGLRDFSDDTWNALPAWQREERIAAGVLRALARLGVPLSTRDLASRIAGDMLDGRSGPGAPEIAKFLGGVGAMLTQAKRDHANAFKNQYGHVSVPWVWLPPGYGGEATVIRAAAPEPAGTEVATLETRPPMTEAERRAKVAADMGEEWNQ